MKRAFETVANKFDRWLDHTSFPALIWNESDRRRIEYLRIGVGLLMIWRLVLILDTARFYFSPPDGWLGVGGDESQFAMLELLLAISVTIGFLTPICIVALVLTYHRFDVVMSTSILGSSVLIHVLVILLATGAGSALSVDNALARFSDGRSGLGGLIRFLYRRMGDPTAAAVRSYFFFGLVAYGVISLGAVLNHASDQYWMSGDTIRVTLQSSYLSRVSGWARATESAHPMVLATFSQVCNLGQGVFQLAMIPLVRWRWGYRFVLSWGAAFFVFSLVFLQLSFLPHFELCLWILVFARSRNDREPLPEFSGIAAPVDDSSRHLAAAYATSNPCRERQRSANATGALLCTFSVVCALAVLSFPQTKRGVDSVLGIDIDTALQIVQPKLDEFLASAGMTPPNVFNFIDLRMGDAWPVIYRLGADGAETVVPLSAVDGHRLWYHISDVIYIGNSLRWRRAMIDADVAAQHQPETAGYLSIEKILRYDYRRSGGSGPVTYRVDLFKSNASRLDVAVDERFTPELVYSYTEIIVE